MPLLPTLGRTVGTGVRAVRLLVRGSVRGSAWATRRVGDARAKGAANEVGMVRLFDLHALSCAGDTLIAIGLAGTIFFNVPLGEARSKVALYLLITMVPFALLAPVVGPVLDHFRHGRRYALATTMLGRAFLAYVISDNLLGFGLYPAAFGVLALSRAYGVARSAAVPRLLPDGIGLSQVGARASVYGTFAGAIVAPIGLAAFWFGPQWPLRIAAIIFVVGMVISLRLPPRADSDPPEAVPRPFRTMLRLRRGTDRPLSGKLVVNTLIGAASLRLLYGFLLLYFAFAVKAGQLETTVFGRDVGSQGAVALVGGALAVGTFLATAIGTRLRIRRPTALQSSGLTITAGVAVLAMIFYSLPMVALLSLVAAIFSGISKLAIDASIQERVPERLRASAFAHSETVLMVAWVVGGAIGIIPLAGRLGVALVAVFAVAGAVRAGIVAARLHNERLHGRPDVPADDPDHPDGSAGRPTGPDHPAPADPWPDAPTVAPVSGGPPAGRSSAPPAPRGASRSATKLGRRPAEALGDDPTQAHPTQAHPTQAHPGQAQSGRRGRSAGESLDPTLVEPPAPAKRFLGWRRKAKRTAPPTATPAPAGPTESAAAGPAGSRSAGSGSTGSAGSSSSATAAEAKLGRAPEPPGEPDAALAPPGFHIYRPSSAAPGDGDTGRTD